MLHPTFILPLSERRFRPWGFIAVAPQVAPDLSQVVHSPTCLPPTNQAERIPVPPSRTIPGIHSARSDDVLAVR